MSKLTGSAALTFLYVIIGRGHPFYLDGIIEALVRRGDIGLVRRQVEMFEISRGWSGLAWRVSRWLYRVAASNRLIGMAYHALRYSNDYNHESPSLALLGRDIRRLLATESGPVIVSHPVMVGILRGRQGLIYQHGELAVPSESLVTGATIVLVPTQEQADQFVKAGYLTEQVSITGLCIEPAIVKQATDAYAARKQRLSGSLPLTGAYFSSGAEPRPHVQAIAHMAISAARAGHRAYIFAQQHGRLVREIQRECPAAGIEVQRIQGGEIDNSLSAPILLLEHATRREENALTARFFPQFDFLVSPAHERTNWALGLGLPMFILEPCFGTFAPLNRGVLLEHDVAVDLIEQGELRAFSQRIGSMRSNGRLTQMAEHGWGRYPINGFDTIAALLAARYA